MIDNKFVDLVHIPTTQNLNLGFQFKVVWGNKKLNLHFIYTLRFKFALYTDTESKHTHFPLYIEIFSN